jgi:hypothetical protein
MYSRASSNFIGFPAGSDFFWLNAEIQQRIFANQYPANCSDLAFVDCGALVLWLRFDDVHRRDSFSPSNHN